MLRCASKRNSLTGISVSHHAPCITHLLFADDSLIFRKAMLEECSELKRIFNLYEVVFGQQLNKNKTALFFSRNTPEAIQEEIKSRFGAQVIRQHEKYLGLPSLIGCNKRNTFIQLKEKLGNKLSR